MKACPPGAVQLARKIGKGRSGKDLRAEIEARLADEPDPAAIWEQVCAYIPHDEWYSQGHLPRPDGGHWRISLLYVFSPSGWETVTGRAATWAYAREAEREAQRKAQELREEEAERAKAIAADPMAAERWRALRERIDGIGIMPSMVYRGGEL